MKKRKTQTIMLAISLVCLLGISSYIAFIYEFPAKQPQIHSTSPVKELRQEMQYIKNNITGPVKEENEPGSNHPDIQTGQVIESNIYVREIPIQLEPEMEEHLAQFRSKAKLLYQEFPDSFRISMVMPEPEASVKTIALTFDDGPDNSSTLEVVNILNRYEIPGTFFLIGQQMDRYSDTVQAILDGGHSLGNHSWSHIRPTDISPEDVLDEVTRAQQKIAGYGAAAKLYRPPYGLVHRSQMPSLIDAGYQVICWSIDSMDWYFDNPEQIVSCVLDNAHPGAIVLMHSSGGLDNRKATIEALPVIIERLLDEGYHFVSLGE